MTAPRDTIRILRRGRVHEIGGFAPDEMLLDHLRLREGARGTKEGCAEGDCGACTVAVGRLDGAGKVRYRPINACIHLLGMADGAEIVTVEDLAVDGLHPLQQAMVDHNASQCGFCTPGFVMALFALHHRMGGTAIDRQGVEDAISGNLCRCTGYRPIVAAALEASAAAPDDGFGGPDTAAALAGIAPVDPLQVGQGACFFAAPTTIDELAELYQRHPDAVLVAGATDVSLWITKALRRIERIIHLGRVDGLRQVHDAGDAIEIGAAATYADAEAALGALDPDIAEVLRRLGSPPIRAAGTIGGNIANASPIGDTPPILIALGAELVLHRGDRLRTLPLEDFFLEYGRQDRQPGEFVLAVRVPRLPAGSALRAYKLSKRFDQDISALLAAVRLDLDGRTVTGARIAFGGMAGTPKRASGAEAALVGASLDRPETWRQALDSLDVDFAPISDHRASAIYRRRTARGLVGKALIEIAGLFDEPTRLREREAVA